MNKISVCIATFNEEENLKDCLDSVKWAEEIVIVDGQSTDKTVALAKKYTDKVIIRKNPLMFHLNKQKAFAAATQDWILYLDADERVSEKLKKEILAVVKKKSYQGFWLPRKNIIFGQWIKHSLWWPDYQLRLFRRGKAFLPCKSVHEQPKLTGKAGYLKNPLIHQSYQTVTEYVERLNHLYTENNLRVFLREKKKIHWYDALRFPAEDFLATFFARKGYRDGLHGLVLSLLQAFSSFITFAKLWEKQGFKEVKQENFLARINREFAHLGKNIGYWLLTARIEEEKTGWGKLILKIKRRLKIKK
ncbi:MAG: glycosyltransferase family 2 protein [Candidatus Marinimicrobia bacterium]|nr:glycosyltransferase family 2 protein [Candidatus Neomarinimicrobiota bacterium]